MPAPLPPTELLGSERAVVLVSCVLSCVGSSLLLCSHALWPELRTRPRQLLLYLSLADLLSALSYFYGVLQDFDRTSWDCVLQGALSTFANTSSFFWTMAIALYLYLTIVRGSPTGTGLLCCFHAVSWGVPLGITVAAVALKKIGYDASNVSVGWCWVNLDAEDRVLWMLLTGKVWEILAYVTLPVLYILIKKHISRAHAALSEYRPILSGAPAFQPRTSIADKKLILIPVIFIFLRIWSTVRFILTLCNSPAVQNSVLVVLHSTINQALDCSEHSHKKMTILLALVALISGFGSSFQYGYNVSVINSPAPYMQDFYNQTYLERTGVPMNSGFQTLLWSLTVSMFPLGGFFGSLLVWPMVNNCGRKGTLLINNLFSIAAAILMGTSELAKTFEAIILSRFIMGIYAGLASNVVPMFLGEMSPRNLRGAIGIVPQLFITVGILVAQILGLNSILGNAEGWPVLLGLTGIPSLIQLLTLPFFPESPRYLLLQKGNEEQARRALRRLRGWDDVDDEIEEMFQEGQSEKEEGQFSVLSLCTFRGLRWQLISIIVMMMGQQLSGVNGVFYYADRIFESAGVPSNSIQYVTVSIGAINVVMTSLAVFIVESLGRRILLLAGFALCCASCAVLTLALNLQTTVSWMSYLSIACVIVYIIGHAVGPSPVPSVMITEMFLQSSRPAAFMVGGSVHWLSNFTVGLVFLYMEAGLGPYSFLIFCAICLATALYIFFIVPETKNKTFMEINRIMAKRNKVEIQENKEELKDFRTAPGGLVERTMSSSSQL
ncbi:Solute carrier family 2, facilitated glucose transporter member 5 [Pitangus sulphuratus]|nr:Solute carrier family 2, facilitated glucose transporter member 5 [Pitangus sulphuratus]